MIDVYEMPDMSSSAPPARLRHLNSHIITEGLDDSKIAALRLFEGILYMLHDNAGVVRAWDIDSGVLRSEWKLPSYTKQWEGMALERRVASNGALRGSTKEEIVLHLVLDTPPQVWTLNVKEGSNRGEIILPEWAMGTK